MWKFFHQFASPPFVYRFCRQLGPFLLVPALVLMGLGIWQGLFEAPADYQQKDAFRIIYVHVPAAYLSMMAYSLMGVASFIGLVWRMKVAHIVAAAAAPIGASFTALALLTGSIWGRPMWGTWWEWGDPRLTSELILLFLYFGFMLLRGSIPDVARADRTGALLAIVGTVNIPIIHYSVVWWSSLHQGSTLIRDGGAAMPPSMLTPLLLSLGGFTLFFAFLMTLRVRGLIAFRERKARWLVNEIQADPTRHSRQLDILYRAFLAIVVISSGAMIRLLFFSQDAIGLISELRASMSGYGVYVWTSFYACFLLLIWNALSAIRLHARTRAVAYVSSIPEEEKS